MKRVLSRLLTGLALLALAACGDPPGGNDPNRLAIATGGVSGVYYIYGGAYAAAISKALPGYVATAEVTAASVDNLRLIGRKRTAIAFTLADVSADAVAGRDVFEQPIPVRALGRIYTTYLQVVARDPAIRTIGDLRGRRVSLGSPGSGSEVVALRVLAAAGLDADRDIQRTGLGVGESAAALGDGSIDAFFWTGGLPTPGVSELATSHRIHIIPTANFVEPLKARHGEVYLPATIEAGVYRGVDADVPVLGIDNLLVVHADMPEDLAYRLTRTLFEQKAALVAAHREARNLDPVAAQRTGGTPLHPGAARYYAEVAAR